MKKEENANNKGGASDHIEDYVPCEMFLEQTGFFSPSSTRINGLFTKEKRMRRRNPVTGSVVETRLTIDALQRFGLPVTFDQDIYRAFLKICDEITDENGRLPESIEVPTKKLLRYAGKATSSRDRAHVREWFEVMRGTQLKGEIYNHRKREYESLITGVFSQAVLRGELLPTGEPATRNHVCLSPWFKDNYECGFVRRFDLNFYKQLRKPVAKALYSTLEIGWYASSGQPFTKSYQKLTGEFLLTKYRYLADVVRQLTPSHDELKHAGFIRSWKIEARKDDFMISYTPGERWFNAQKARLRRVRMKTGKTASERDDTKAQSIIHSQNELELDFIVARKHEIKNLLTRRTQ